MKKEKIINKKEENKNKAGSMEIPSDKNEVYEAMLQALSIFTEDFLEDINDLPLQERDIL